MARANAAAVAAPATTRPRKPAAAGGRATTQAPRRTTRRSSGPATGRNAAGQRQSASARAREATAASAPGVAVPRPAPARPATRTAPRTAPRRRARRRTATAPFVLRVAHGPVGALVDRLLRGRACVAIVFVLLVGIVFLNVSLLEMNSGIAATNDRANALEQQNAKLREQIAPLASSERIQSEAVKRGYSLPAAGDVDYIAGDTNALARRAADRMTAPGTGTGVASMAAAQELATCQANCQLPTANPTADAGAPSTTTGP
jgi:cell division protein FtsL